MQQHGQPTMSNQQPTRMDERSNVDKVAPLGRSSALPSSLMLPSAATTTAAAAALVFEAGFVTSFPPAPQPALFSKQRQERIDSAL